MSKPSKRKREIDQFDMNGSLIKTHESLAAASEATGINQTSICLSCRGKYSNAGGFVFRYNNSKVKIKKDPLDDLIFIDDPEEELVDDGLIMNPFYE